MAGIGRPPFRVRPLTVSALIRIVLASTLAVALSAPSLFAQEGGQKVKKPVFSGTFYPSDPALLARTIDGYLKEADKAERIPSPVFALISPHAGYEYSGQVAAFGYSQVKAREYKTVILIGSSHRVPFKGIAIYPAGSWETPLGRVSVDSEVAKGLMERVGSMRDYPLAFEKEHSLEVQLPFLQRTLKGFRIVPLVTGEMTGEDYRALSDALYWALRRNPKAVLIVASSDMSHYRAYGPAKEMDTLALRRIRELDVEHLAGDMGKGSAELCGAQGVLTLMMVARMTGADVTTLRYANSGDVTGDKSRVVGYGAVAFSYGAEQAGELSRDDRGTLLRVARKTLEAYVSTRTVPHFEVTAPRLKEKRGVFVTLNKKGNLRGCIGYILPHAPLQKAVTEMTLNACSRDPRFPPVTRDELKDIEIEISVLSPLKPIQKVEEVEVGRHGLYITRGGNAGLLLPQVASSNKWSRTEFLRQTCRKAGLPDNAWQEKGTAIYIFSAQIWSEGKEH